MGMYFNPGNEGFQSVLAGEYVDKTGMIRLINENIGTKQKLICVSRPRRFGKSFAAQMLSAYYDCSCDSASLFENLSISKDPTYHRHLNQYMVIYLDITNILGKTTPDRVVEFIEKAVTSEIQKQYPRKTSALSFDEILLAAVEQTGKKFIVIIDEWDALFREDENGSAAQEAYIRFLRMLFKSSGTTDKIFAAAYMTGILPIKKYGTQSAVSDFREYTMVKPRQFGEFVGFTEREVRTLCQIHEMPFEEMREWYDGYYFDGIGSVYSPNSVMEAIQNREFDSYWQSSETYETLREYIDTDYDGLQQDIIRMMGGASVPVRTTSFQNDMTSIRSKDDVMTLLVHLGYLAYDAESSAVRIPNAEVSAQFVDAVRNSEHQETAKLIARSDRLIRDTIEGNEAEVAKEFDQIHNSYIAPLFYNDEQALRSVVKTAYISCINHYIRIEELPSGKGYADIVYFPRIHSIYPLLLIELKWNVSSEGAIGQIKAKNYPAAVRDYGREIILVGINYDPKSKKHICRIEKFQP